MVNWKEKKILLLVVIVLVGVGINLFLTQEEKAKHQGEPEKLTVNKKPAPTLVSIYISGAVIRPGVYKVPLGTRVQEALGRAGGCSLEAALHKVNMVRKCKDGLHIHVPWERCGKKSRSKGEDRGSSRKRQRVGAQVKSEERKNKAVSSKKSKAGAKRESLSSRKLPQGKVNLNTATLEELMTLPGVGRAIAQGIVEYRKTHHFFYKGALLKVPGMTKRKLKTLSPWLEV